MDEILDDFIELLNNLFFSLWEVTEREYVEPYKF